MNPNDATVTPFSKIMTVLNSSLTVLSVVGLLLGVFVFFSVVVLKSPIRKQTKSNLNKYRNQTKYNPDLYVECDKAHEVLRYAIGTRKWRKRLKKLVKDTKKSVNCISRKWQKVVGSSARIPIGNSIKKIKQSIDKLKNYFNGVYKCQGRYVNIDGVDVYKESSNVSRQIRVLDDYEEILNAVIARTIIVSSTAGNGKSFLLARIAEMLLGSKRAVLFINGRDMRDDPESYFWNRLFNGLYKPVVSRFFLLLMNLIAIILDRKLVIIIDAINENDSDDFKVGIINLVLFLQPLKGIKIIVSCRKEFIDNRFKDFFDALGIRKEKDKYGYAERYKGNHDTAFLELRNEFRLVPRLQDVFFSKYKHYYCFLGTISPYVKLRLAQCSRLTIRAFFECYNNKTENISSFNRDDVFAMFIDQVCKSNNTTWDQLTFLARKMLELNQYYNIPQHLLWPLYEKLQEIDNTLITQSPLESICSSNLIKQHEDVFSFSFDELRDFFIARVIVSDNANEQDVLDKVKTMRNHDTIFPVRREVLSIFEGVVSFLYLYYYKTKNYKMCEDILLILVRNARITLPSISHDIDDLFLGLQLIFDCGGPTEQFEKTYIEKLLLTGSPGIIDQMIVYYDQTNNWRGFITLLTSLDREAVRIVLSNYLSLNKAPYTHSSPVDETFSSCLDQNGMYSFLLVCYAFNCTSFYEIERVIGVWKPTSVVSNSLCSDLEIMTKILQCDKLIRNHLNE